MRAAAAMRRRLTIMLVVLDRFEDVILELHRPDNRDRGPDRNESGELVHLIVVEGHTATGQAVRAPAVDLDVPPDADGPGDVALGPFPGEPSPVLVVGIVDEQGLMVQAGGDLPDDGVPALGGGVVAGVALVGQAVEPSADIGGPTGG